MVSRYSKQFAGSVTGLYNKYWGDSFFRAEFNIIALQVGFITVLLFVVSVSFNHLYENIVQTIIGSITDSLQHNQVVSGQEVFRSIQLIKAKDFFSLFAITVVITIIFGYIIARVTLKPTREAFQSQKRFISDVAHELRTPLAIIKTNSEVALLNTDMDPAMRDTIVSNMQELTRASEIINNLLSLNSMIRPERMQFADVNLGVILDAVHKKMEKLAAKRDVSLSVSTQTPDTVWGNATALEQIVENLLRNAIAYTPARGSVTASVEPDYHGNVRVTIRDTGIGIAQKDLVHIFEPFYRAERSRNRQSGSSGLGLTIVSELLKIHSGRILIKSAVNKGTVVEVTLPLSKHSIPVQDVIEKLTEVSMDFFNKT